MRLAAYGCDGVAGRGFASGRRDASEAADVRPGGVAGLVDQGGPARDCQEVDRHAAALPAAPAAAPAGRTR